MESSEYKRYHESFTRNNNGTNAFHTYFCMFFTVQCSLICSLQINSTRLRYVTEYLIIILPLILTHTILANYLYYLNIVAFTFLVINILIIKSNSQYKIFMVSNQAAGEKLESISSMRGLTYLITGLCIVAVDFQQFPRNLAKTERFGYSLMDTGVGLFVLMSGLVHRNLKKDKVLKSNLKLISILLVLGISRYVSIKQLDYHEHVTEYGVHWNFFFTLAVCKLLSTVLLLLSSKVLLMSILTLILHEILLHYSLQDWVFSKTPRSTFIDANREGITSSLGYVFMYLFAVYLKTIINSKNKNKYSVLSKLITISIISIILAYFFNLFKPTSRTLANAGYCLFLISALLTVLTLLYTIEISLYDKEYKSIFKTPLLLSAINDNGLVYFLICNLTTGLINILFQTFLLPFIATFIILNTYMILTLSLTIYLNRIGFKY